MAEFRRGPRDHGDSLPWLEPVEAEDGGTARVRDDRAPGGRVILLVVIALLVVTVVVALTMWLRDRGDDSGPPGVIKAPEGPYKVPTDEVGGMAVAGQGDRTYATSQGDDAPSTIDLSALPEAPMTDRAAPPAIATRTPPKPAAAKPETGKPAPTATTAPPAAKTPAPAKPAAKPVVAIPPPAPEPPAASGTIQLGAFSSEAKANAAWTALSKRFTALAPLGKIVQPVAKDGSTLYRLRAAAGGQAGAICGKLRVAGESCSVVGN